jgi:DNA polymerase III subunit gamma/tau
LLLVTGHFIYQHSISKNFKWISLQGMNPRMSNFIVSARKYRPVNFDTVVGQPAVTSTLKSAIRTRQIAHAYLFCGPRGVGKTTCARIFAKTLNCFNLSENTEACDHCESCKSFNESRSFNIHELDAASNNSVEDIRNLIDKVRILPQVGKYSIYIIDEVHMLSQAAFNAFLKTLEEPPPHAIFVLATTEKHKIIPTILSRCQIFDFHRIRVEDIVGHLAGVARLENTAFEEEALNVIALKADGAMRDALTIFDQVSSFSNKNITYKEVLDNLNVLDYEYYFRITEAFLEGSASKALMIFNDILQRGFDGQNFIGGLSSHLRDLLVCHDESTLQLLEVSESLKNRYKQQAAVSPADFLFAALETCNQCELAFKASRNQRLHVELALIRLCSIVGEKKKLNSPQKPLEIPDLPRQGERKKVAETKPADLEIMQAGKPLTIREPEQVIHTVPKISIKDALKAADANSGAAGNQPAKQNGDDRILLNGNEMYKPLSEESLRKCWNSFAVQIHEEKPRMAVTLKNVQPRIINNFTIAIELNNRSQLDDFLINTKNDLENFLKREMQNNRIIIEASLLESSETSRIKLYTSEEKFQYLNQKNPLLAKFRQKLNLELE